MLILSYAFYAERIREKNRLYRICPSLVGWQVNVETEFHRSTTLADSRPLSNGHQLITQSAILLIVHDYFLRRLAYELASIYPFDPMLWEMGEICVKLACV